MTITPQQNKFLDAATAIQLDRSTITDAAFIATQLVQATLPHSDPKADTWTRRNGNFTLGIQAGFNHETEKSYGLPYGSLPRLVLLWINTEAVKTKSRRLELGSSLAQFMRQLDLDPSHGGKRGDAQRLHKQMQRLFHAKISFIISQTTNNEQHGRASIDMQVAPKSQFWWNLKDREQGTLWNSWIELGEDFYNSIISWPIPVDLRAIKALKHSPLAIDLYQLLCRECQRVQKSAKTRLIPWRSLMQQVGANYTGEDAAKNFARKVRKELRAVQNVMPTLKLELVDGGFTILEGSTPPIESRATSRPQKATARHAETVHHPYQLSDK